MSACITRLISITAPTRTRVLTAASVSVFAGAVPLATAGGPAASPPRSDRCAVPTEGVER